jgi:hypothetical protein
MHLKALNFEMYSTILPRLQKNINTLVSIGLKSTFAKKIGEL